MSIMQKVKGMLGIKDSCDCSCSQKEGEKSESCCKTNETDAEETESCCQTEESKSESCGCGSAHEEE